MSDLELGLQYLLGSNPQYAAKRTHNIACNTLTDLRVAEQDLPESDAHTCCGFNARFRGWAEYFNQGPVLPTYKLVL